MDAITCVTFEFLTSWLGFDLCCCACPDRSKVAPTHIDASRLGIITTLERAVSEVRAGTHRHHLNNRIVNNHERKCIKEERSRRLLEASAGDWKEKELWFANFLVLFFSFFIQFNALLLKWLASLFVPFELQEKLQINLSLEVDQTSSTRATLFTSSG